MISNEKTLIDPFKRRLRYLRISVTDLCNFKCFYCLPKGYQCKRPRNEISVNEIKNLVRGFATLGTEKIRLTGGEPTLRRDISEIIRVSKEPENIKKVAMTTNGWQIEKYYKEWRDAGLDQINLSIDSLNNQHFQDITGKNCLKNILHTLDDILTEQMFSVKINAVLLKDYGISQLDDALAFVKDKNISYRFIELMQTGDNYTFFKNNHFTGQSIIDTLKKRGWRAISREIDAGPAVEYTHPDYLGKIGIIAPYSKDFCTNCNRLRVTAQGKMHLCLFDSVAFDLRHLLGDNDEQAFVNHIQELIAQKPKSHYLHDENIGLINNLSVIGG